MVTMGNKDETGTEPQQIVVRDHLGPMPSFSGKTVADLCWTYDEARERGHRRWTDITLYRVLQDDIPFAYMIQVVGRSVVYHKNGGPCRRGVNLLVGSLVQDEARYDALEACQEPGCEPTDLDDLSDSDKVSVEVDIPSLHKCKDAAEAVKILYDRGGRERESGPSIKLLQAAAIVDEDIAAAMMQVRAF